VYIHRHVSIEMSILIDRYICKCIDRDITLYIHRDITTAGHRSLTWASRIQFTHPANLQNIHLIRYFHLSVGFTSGIFPSGFPTKTLYTSLPCPMRSTWPGDEYKLRSNFLHPPVTSFLLGTSRNILYKLSGLQFDLSIPHAMAYEKVLHSFLFLYF
jgi:hypothetical protein